jgi:Bacterial regulatory proteins, tetR family
MDTEPSLSPTHFGDIPGRGWILDPGDRVGIAGARIVVKEDAPRRRVHNRDREEDILIAARAVFEERGFDAASVAEIARRSHVAEGTIYLYSATKREVLQEVVESWYESSPIKSKGPACRAANRVVPFMKSPEPRVGLTGNRRQCFANSRFHSFL